MISEIDEIDYQIIEMLRNNARLSNKQLADHLKIAQSTCLSRVRYLRARGFIGEAHCEIDFAKLGFAIQAMITVRLHQHSRAQLESFQAHLRSLPEVLTSYHLGGANDFMVQIATRDAQSLRDFIVSEFTEREEVAHIETALIYEQVKNWRIPPNFFSK